MKSPLKVNVMVFLLLISFLKGQMIPYWTQGQPMINPFGGFQGMMPMGYAVMPTRIDRQFALQKSNLTTDRGLSPNYIVKRQVNQKNNGNRKLFLGGLLNKFDGELKHLKTQNRKLQVKAQNQESKALLATSNSAMRASVLKRSIEECSMAFEKERTKVMQYIEDIRAVGDKIGNLIRHELQDLEHEEKEEQDEE